MTPTSRPYKAEYHWIEIGHFWESNEHREYKLNREPCEVIAYTARSYKIKLTRYHNKTKTVRRRNVRGMEQAGIAETSNYKN